MKIKSLLLITTALFFFACGGNDKDKGPDCSSAPLLSKSCLAGKWYMGATSTDRSLFPNAVTTFDISEVRGVQYNVEFIVNKANYKLPLEADSIAFAKVGSDHDHTGYGVFSLSEDQTQITIEFNDGDIAGFYFSGKAEMFNENFIIFEATKKPPFANEQMTPVNMILKRVQ
ncbi:MAG: hypothetical protein GX801_09595 [Fibrobacter sp.]|nr:hypothetical protein [Fibrobacter sp.]